MELVPRDEYRWGYRLCAEQYTGLPLKAQMLGAQGKPMLQYAFVKVREGVSGLDSSMRQVKVPASNVVQAKSPVMASQLPPGYSEVIAVKRKLPDHDTEVEHSIYSDGLNHISIFVEPAPKHMVDLEGESVHGLVNLRTRKVGSYQVTVVGDAPAAAVEMVAHSLVVAQ